MRLSHQHKFIFLAYPRTASSSIRQLLDAYSDIKSVHLADTTKDFPFHHHMTAKDLKTVFEQRGWDWSEYKKFCVVRNPYARLLSLFRRRREVETQWQTNISFAGNISNWFLRKLPSKLAFSLYVLTRTQTRGPAGNLHAFTCDKSGRLLVDTILSYENLEHDLPNYLDSLGLELKNYKMPHLNRSQNRINYPSWYTLLTKRKVENTYADEIKRFAYRFNDQ